MYNSVLQMELCYDLVNKLFVWWYNLYFLSNEAIFLPQKSNKSNLIRDVHNVCLLPWKRFVNFAPLIGNHLAPTDQISKLIQLLLFLLVQLETSPQRKFFLRNAYIHRCPCIWITCSGQHFREEREFSTLNALSTFFN